MNERPILWKLIAASAACAGSLALVVGACHAPVEPPALSEGSNGELAVAALPGPVDAQPLQDDEEPPESYDPCMGKICGEACQLCPPGTEETCTEQVRQCDASGMCSHLPPTCTTDD